MYDALDRVRWTTQDSELGPLVTGIEWLAGFQQRVTNPRGFATTTSYQAFESPATDFPLSIVEPAGVTTTITRDGFGKALAISRTDALSVSTLTRQFVYDAEQRLCKEIHPESGATVYWYDAVGNRTRTLTGSGLTAPVCDRTSAPWRMPFGMTYFHVDHQGTPVARSDAWGAVFERTRRQSFGQPVVGVLRNGPGYTGHMEDPSTGLVYMQQRYYDPAIGRFLSVDPVGPLDDPVRHFGRYHYALNNPYRFTDPDGRIPLDTLIDVGFLIYDGGRFLGAAAAAGVGAATGNEALRSEGLAGMREVGPDLVSSAVSAVTPYASAPMARMGKEAVAAVGDAARVKEQRERRAERRENLSRSGTDGARDRAGNLQKPSGKGFRDRLAANKGPSGDRPSGPDRSNNRERNVGIDEEHSMKPKGGLRRR